MKISIIGIGQVGASLAFGLALKETVSDIVLVHHRPEIADANAADLQHAMLFANRRINIQAGDMEATAHSDIVVITASRPWRENFADRLDAACANTELFAEIIPAIAAVNPTAKLLIISNPVDVLSYHAVQLSGYEPHRVIGTGTLVDSARFRGLLADETDIHPVDLRAYILGEHGNSQFPIFSSAETGGMKIAENASRREMAKSAATVGVEVFSTKGNTNFVISSAALHIIETIVKDSRHTMPVSVHVDDFYGVSDLFLSVPAVIGIDGVMRILKPKLNSGEINSLQKSASVIREVITRTKSVYSQ